MKKYDTVCFDIDGTLYPTEVLNRYLFTLTLKHPRMCMLYRKLRTRFRVEQDDFDNTDLRDACFSVREAAMFFKVLQAKGNKKIKSIEQAREMLDLRYYLPLYKSFKAIKYQPDAVKTFEYLKQHGIKTGVFSDWPLCNKLETIGVKNYIDVALSPDDTGYLKPSSECFEILLDKLKANPDSTLYVGDSYSKDIEGARKAGIDAVLINCRKADFHVISEKYPKALKVFSCWKDFDMWIKDII